MKDWKTTLLGLASGALNLFANGTGWKQVLLSVAVAALGVFTQDSSLGKKA